MAHWYETELTPGGRMLRALTECESGAFPSFGSGAFGQAVHDAFYRFAYSDADSRREVRRDLRKITRAYANGAQWLTVHAFHPKRYQPGEDVTSYEVVGWRGALALIRKLRWEAGDRGVTFVVEDTGVRRALDAATEYALAGE